MTMADDPIRDEHREQMNQLARFLDEQFNGEAKGKDRKYGFALLVFDFGTGGYMNYISNAQRPDMERAMLEFLRRSVGRQ